MNVLTSIFSYQLPGPPSFPDNSSLAFIDPALIKFWKILPSLADQASSSERQSISDKNHSILEGVAFGAVALFATWIGLIKSSERHENLQRSVHSKQQKKEPDNTEWHHTLRLFSKASQMVGSTWVAVAYMAILWVGGESTSQINCGAQEVQDALDAFPLLETPGDIVSSLGDCTLLLSVRQFVSQTFMLVQKTCQKEKRFLPTEYFSTWKAWLDTDHATITRSRSSWVSVLYRGVYSSPKLSFL